MVDKNLIAAINKLRGVGGSTPKAKVEPKEPTNVAPQPTANVTSQPSVENKAALDNFLNSVPETNTGEEKTYTMQDLDNFIESLVKPK